LPYDPWQGEGDPDVSWTILGLVLWVVASVTALVLMLLIGEPPRAVILAVIVFVAGFIAIAYYGTGVFVHLLDLEERLLYRAGRLWRVVPIMSVVLYFAVFLGLPLIVAFVLGAFT
jgi:hypothetical protein